MRSRSCPWPCAATGTAPPNTWRRPAPRPRQPTGERRGLWAGAAAVRLAESRQDAAAVVAAGEALGGVPTRRPPPLDEAILPWRATFTVGARGGRPARRRPCGPVLVGARRRRVDPPARAGRRGPCPHRRPPRRRRTGRGSGHRDPGAGARVPCRGRRALRARAAGDGGGPGLAGGRGRRRRRAAASTAGAGAGSSRSGARRGWPRSRTGAGGGAARRRGRRAPPGRRAHAQEQAVVHVVARGAQQPRGRGRAVRQRQDGRAPPVPGLRQAGVRSRTRARPV